MVAASQAAHGAAAAQVENITSGKCRVVLMDQFTLLPLLPLLMLLLPPPLPLLLLMLLQPLLLLA